MTNLKQDIQRQIQEWIFAEEKAGRSVDTNRINEYLQDMMRKHNSSHRAEFNGLTPEQMSEMLYDPFGPNCLVQFNHLSEEQYMQIPLVKQTLFLMQTLSEKELKMTQNGWLPLKIVNESYHLGRPIYIIESLGMKRINEYDATSVWMTHLTLDFLGWIKVRKGMLSLTAKGKKALSDVDAAANEIIRFSLVGTGLHNFDGYEDDRIGNLGMAYSVWLLNKFGSEWHTGRFYQEHYQKVINIPEEFNSYASRVFYRLFYWLGIVDIRLNREVPPPFEEEYKKTDLISMIFSFSSN
jgi:hypothetical protein